ncbi:MAG TPA: cytochrome c oxidase subunit 3 family protein, partial [Plasticicumulans sp.]|nr:cytochrome c oxidase subunit 3 family protein [Plasticicumulans sp.]
MMTAAVPAIDDRPPLPGDLAMWFFILAELTVFAALFLAFAYARLWH